MRTSTKNKIKVIRPLVESGKKDWAERAASKLGMTRQGVHYLTQRHIGTHPTEHAAKPISRESKKAITLMKKEFKKGTRNWVEVVVEASGLTQSQVKSLAINYAQEEYNDHLKNGTVRRHAKLIKMWNRGVAPASIAERLGLDVKVVYSTVASLRNNHGMELAHARA